MTYYLLKSPPTKVLPDGRQIQLEVDENGELREPGESNEDYFAFGSLVGRDSPNQREDVLRAQTLLGHAGYFDMERTEGPTGWYGKPLELGIRKFQKDNGLAVDGYMEPGGETLVALKDRFGETFAPYKPPGLKLIDEHHERRARGEPGLLNIERGRGSPFGVPLAATTKDMKPRPREHLFPSKDKEIRPTLLSGTRWDQEEILLAGKAHEDLLRNPKRNAPSLPDIGGGGGPIGVGPLLKGAAKAGAAAAEQHDAQKLKDFVSNNSVSLELGITQGFGKVERHETENTTESGRAVRDACLKALAARGLKEFEHVAGGREQEDESVEKREWTVKDGKFHSAGGGHSLPDLIFSDGKVFFAVNTATESGGKFIAREITSFDRLLKNLGKWTAEIISKKRDNETWDDYRKRADELCNQGIDNMLENERRKAQNPQDGQQQPEPSDYPSSP